MAKPAQQNADAMEYQNHFSLRVCIDQYRQLVRSAPGGAFNASITALRTWESAPGERVRFSSDRIFTPGDACDVLVAMNAAALKTNLTSLKKGGKIIVNTDGFDSRNLRLANYPENRAFFDGKIDSAGGFGYIYERAALAYGTAIIGKIPESDQFLDISFLKSIETAFPNQQASLAPTSRPGRPQAAYTSGPLRLLPWAHFYPVQRR